MSFKTAEFALGGRQGVGFAEVGEGSVASVPSAKGLIHALTKLRAQTFSLRPRDKAVVSLRTVVLTGVR